MTQSSSLSNDSNEPSLAYYMSVVSERKDLLAKIRRLHDELAELAKNITHNNHVKNEMQRQIKEFFMCEVPDLMAYKGLKDIVQDGISIQTRMYAHKEKLEAAILEYEKKRKNIEDHLQSMKVYFKGKGKVISLEGYRSQKANRQ